MTCCVAINAKEGDCWIQLIIVYCPWCYTNVISDISHSPSSDIQQMQSQFLPNSLGHRRKVGEVSFYRAHSVLTRDSVLTEFTRWLKDFMGFSVLTEHSRLTQEIIFWYRVYRAGSASKEFTEICISADCCNDLYSKLFWADWLI